jgi:hypothetical protein
MSDDKFGGADRVDYAAYRAEAVSTTSDDFNVTHVTKALYVGATGDVNVIMAGDQTSGTPVKFAGVPAGSILPIRVLTIKKSGTTAASIVALS